MHRCPAPHAMPHPPQLAGSVFVLTHWPLQYDIPVVHPQEPFAHVAPPVHSTSHAPQLRGLFERFVHVPWQSSRPAEQAQAPPAQIRSAGHDRLQSPQCFGSVRVSTQKPEHWVCCAPH
jgi:hypothetical protein